MIVECIDENLDLLNDRVALRDVTSQNREMLKRACQTNLRFLVNCVLRPASSKFLPLREKVHGPIFDSFLKMDPGVPWDHWSDVKERSTLAFRGALKSTIDAGFLTQVLLCDPDLRVLVLSGKLPHAKTIMATARQPFCTNEVLRELFPEWAVEFNDLTGDSFICPHRTEGLNLRDASLTIGTFDSVKAGGHYELLLFDDCTNEVNCATPDQVEKNVEHYDDTEGLVEPGGYRHFFGTRWAPDEADLPEVIRIRGEEYQSENGFGNTENTLVPVWTLREDGTPVEVQERRDRDQRDKLKPEDVKILWPEKITTRFLWPKYRANPQKFNGQYLLRWKGSFLAESVTKDFLLSLCRPFAEGMPLPHNRFCFVNWDLGGIYTGRRRKSKYDFSCGLAGMFELSTRRLFLYDAIQEVFSSSTEAATAIVQFYAQQLKIGPVGLCRIEDNNGTRMLEGEINAIARKLNVPIELFWEPQENTDNAKNVGISQLVGGMRKGLVQFSSVFPYQEQIFKQFTNWSPTSASKKKDDGPDSAAQIWKFHTQVFPNLVKTQTASGQEITFEPEIIENVDPHADEKEYADFALLGGMTVAHTEF